MFQTWGRERERKKRRELFILTYKENANGRLILTNEESFKLGIKGDRGYPIGSCLVHHTTVQYWKARTQEIPRQLYNNLKVKEINFFKKILNKVEREELQRKIMVAKLGQDYYEWKRKM